MNLPAVPPRRLRAMLRVVGRLLRDARGATAIEYGLLAALVAVVVITGVRTIGTNLGGTFSRVGSATVASR